MLDDFDKAGEHLLNQADREAHHGLAIGGPDGGAHSDQVLPLERLAVAITFQIAAQRFAGI